MKTIKRYLCLTLAKKNRVFSRWVILHVSISAEDELKKKYSVYLRLDSINIIYYVFFFTKYT